MGALEKRHMPQRLGPVALVGVAAAAGVDGGGEWTLGLHRLCEGKTDGGENWMVSENIELESLPLAQIARVRNGYHLKSVRERCPLVLN